MQEQAIEILKKQLEDAKVKIVSMDTIVPKKLTYHSPRLILNVVVENHDKTNTTFQFNLKKLIRQYKNEGLLDASSN